MIDTNIMTVNSRAARFENSGTVLNRADRKEILVNNFTEFHFRQPQDTGVYGSYRSFSETRTIRMTAMFEKR